MNITEAKTCLEMLWFSLPGHQVPTKAALSLPPPNWTGQKNMTKGSCVKIRTGRDHSPVTVIGKTD